MSDLKNIQGVAESLDAASTQGNVNLEGQAEQLRDSVASLLEGVAAKLDGEGQHDLAAQFRADAAEFAPRLGAVNPVTQPGDPNPVAGEGADEVAQAEAEKSEGKSQSKK